ncbi:MAG: ABC transporter permease subunit, partial [Planctomycetota bacterium]
SAMTAALAGLFYMANELVAAPVNQGRGHELNAIAAAVVGGCSLQGGAGTVPGTVLGALFLRVVIDAVSKLIKASADVYEGMIVGIIVALAVTCTQFGRFGQGGRSLFPGIRGLAAIPAIAILLGLLATMAAANVDLLAGRTALFGGVVGAGVLVALAAVRHLQGRRGP